MSETNNTTDIAIIGAGPAGLSAAIYVQRAGKKSTVFESMTVGGQIVNTPEIANYPGIKKVSGFEFSMGLYEQATELGAEIIYDEVADVKRVDNSNDMADHYSYRIRTGSGKVYKAKAVIIATGAKNRHLGIDREEELLGRGVSYCATCDGAFYKGKDVAVNGGGNTALDDALFLSNYCNKVYIIHRRDEFRGEPEKLELLKTKENVEFVLNSTVRELRGEKSLEEIVVSSSVQSDKQDDVQASDQVAGERIINVQGLFIAIGQVPDNIRFADLVELDKSGYIIADESCKSKTPGVFVAGDTRTKNVRQLTTAAADGAVAALGACEFIK